jgi:hypothetical protein
MKEVSTNKHIKLSNSNITQNELVALLKENPGVESITIENCPTLGYSTFYNIALFNPGIFSQLKKIELSGVYSDAMLPLNLTLYRGTKNFELFILRNCKVLFESENTHITYSTVLRRNHANNQWLSLEEAIETNDESVCDDLINHQPDINVRIRKNGLTFLQFSLSLGRENIAKKLLLAGANEAIDSNTYTLTQRALLERIRAEIFLDQAIKEIKKPSGSREEASRLFLTSVMINPTFLCKFIEDLYAKTVSLEPSQQALFLKAIYNTELSEETKPRVFAQIGEMLYCEGNDFAILFLRQGSYPQDDSCELLYFQAYRKLLGLPTVVSGGRETIEDLLKSIPQDEQWRIEHAQKALVSLENRLNQGQVKEIKHRRHQSDPSFFVDAPSSSTATPEKEEPKKQHRRSHSK